MISRKQEQDNWLNFWKYHLPILEARERGEKASRPEGIELDNYLTCLKAMKIKFPNKRAEIVIEDLPLEVRHHYEKND